MVSEVNSSGMGNFNWFDSSSESDLPSWMMYIDEIQKRVDSAEDAADPLEKLKLLNQALELCENAPEGVEPSSLLIQMMGIYEERGQVFLGLGRVEDAIRDQLSSIQCMEDFIEQMIKDFEQMPGISEEQMSELKRGLRSGFESAMYDLQVGMARLALGEKTVGNESLQNGAAKGCLLSAFLLKAQGIDPDLILSVLPENSLDSYFDEVEILLLPLMAAHRYEEALAAVEEFIEENPTDDSAIGHRALLLCIVGRWEEGLEAVNGISFEDSESTPYSIPYAYHAFKAIILTKLGRSEEAALELAMNESFGLDEAILKQIALQL